MCGRYTLTTPPGDLQRSFDLCASPSDLRPRFNIAPGQTVAVVPNDDERRVRLVRWGLIPSWAKDPSIGHRLINARAETLAVKPSFRSAVRHRRCLVLADGFYEWKKEDERKVPMYVRLVSRRPFAFAGLWERWEDPHGAPITSCTIVTTEANALVAPIHDRMPVILPPRDYAAWLESEPRDVVALASLLRPFAEEPMEAFAVSRLVNSPRNDQPECCAPA